MHRLQRSTSLRPTPANSPSTDPPSKDPQFPSRAHPLILHMVSQEDCTSSSRQTQRCQPSVLPEPRPERTKEVPTSQNTHQEPPSVPAQLMEPSRHGESRTTTATGLRQESVSLPQLVEPSRHAESWTTTATGLRQESVSLPAHQAQRLQPTREGQPILGAVGPWEGIVAAVPYSAQGWSPDFVITTPNAKWVPEIAVAHSEITTFADGRWGRHEYSQWPQQFAHDAFHIHCIPSQPRIDGPGNILWRTLQKDDWKPDDCGVVGVGFLDRDLEKQLGQQATDAVNRFQDCRLGHKGWNDLGDFLVACLRHAFDRLRCLPAVPGVIISLAAHVQRLTLELFGLVEWLGKVFERVKTKQDCRWLVLDVVGAHTSDPSVAQMLHLAGIPVWFQQPFSTHLAVYEVVVSKDLPDSFSRTPSYPRLVLAKRDLSGALNMPGEWQRVMATIVRRQLCDSRLPALLEAEKAGSLPPAKRLREGAVFLHEDSASVGPATPSFVVQNARDAKSLGHDLPVASSISNPELRKPSRRTRARHAKLAALAAAPAEAHPSLMHPHTKDSSMNPFRQFYPSQTIVVPRVWSSVLTRLGPLPQPRTSVKYFFAPPWLLDALVGFETKPDKTARYLHHWISIRTFCRIRLFDQTIAGRPLTVSEWRDALWGDYHINEVADSSSQPHGRWKVRRELQQNIRRLFGQGQSLPSYCVDSHPHFGNSVVTYDAALSDRNIQRRVVWESYETNWRCELLALDAVMTGSNEWSELLRWMREFLVSQVWGSGTSGLDIIPPVDDMGPLASPWLAPPEEGWESCRVYLSAFIEVLSRWPQCPGELCNAYRKVLHSGAEDFTRLLEAAVTFYVCTFVSKFDRLPVPPVCTSPLAPA